MNIAGPSTALAWAACLGALLCAALGSCNEPAPQPAPAPRVVVLDPSTWVGTALSGTPLAEFVELDALPSDATWVLYRVDCEHCAEHLRRLAAQFPDAPKLYVLAELGELGAHERRVVRELPPGEHVRLTDGVQWATTPPWEFDVEAGVVRAARQDQPR